jgi:HSP20 family protein
VHIEMVGRTLHVRGERKPGEGPEAVINEISHGRFKRELTVPEEIDTKKVQAVDSYGMLELTLPLAEASKPHRIVVAAGPEDKKRHAA